MQREERSTRPNATTEQAAHTDDRHPGGVMLATVHIFKMVIISHKLPCPVT